jgi:hypothetical protein
MGCGSGETGGGRGFFSVGACIPFDFADASGHRIFGVHLDF